jgi:hypothetical protein
MWWDERRAELVDLAGESGPVLVYDGEALNDLAFDLLSLDCVDGLLFDTGLSVHPRLLAALGRLGAGFLCRSAEEAGLVLRRALTDPASCVGLPRESRGGDEWKRWPPGVVPAVPLGADLPASPERLWGSEVLVVPEGTTTPGSESGVAARLRALDRMQARIRGFYMPRDLAARETIPTPAEWPVIAGRDGILVAGGGTGIVLDGETGAPDLLRTAERLEPWRNVFPEGELRVEPGGAFFSPMAALVVVEGKKVRVRAPAPLEPRSGSPERPVERFLNARRICPVPL